MNTIVLLPLVLLPGLAIAGTMHAVAATPTRPPEWELVRSVPNPFGGTMDFVLVPERRQRDRAFYQAVSDTVCGTRVSCMVHFWTDRTHIPSSAQMPVPDLQRMTAQYERSPKYKASVLSLACWLYPSKAVADGAHCFYMPGAVMPWEK